MNNVPITLLKSTLTAGTIFWFILLQEENLLYRPLMLIVFSIFPIIVLSSSIIMISIYPFTVINNNTFTKRDSFKKYFPYYTLVTFVICLFSTIAFQFDVFAIAFFSSAFITLMFAWVWMFKPKKNEIQQNTDL